ncbi:MAG TPA: ABC transporter substrate-binding protein [Solirubrobacteraceae bacterium]|jgi:ABC-type transport system substrate-binding protein|nr:ABC transporter substrate-binding protein [Solirubrobacteraceae bacterium]
MSFGQVQTAKRRLCMATVTTLAAGVVAAVAMTGSAGASGRHATAARTAHSINTNGTISIGSTTPPSTLDPATSTSGDDYTYLYFLFDRLINRNNKTGMLQPMLATSWKFVGRKKLELVVNLRHGVSFQDGTPFNAQAVVYFSKQYIANGDAGNDLQYVKSVSASGTYQVTYHLTQQNAQLPDGLADRAGMIASPTAMQKEGKNFGTAPVGTGPYKFVSQVQGASYDFTRSDTYWNNAKDPRVENVDIKIFQTDTALISAIRSGDVDIAQSVYPQDVKGLKSDSNLDVASGPNVTFNLAYFDGARAPLNNRQIRLAFNLALNRKAIMEAATDGLGQVWTEAQPHGTLGYVKSLDPLWKYNPKKARSLVKQSGVKSPSITCLEYPGYGYEITAPIIIAEEKAVGINLKVIPGPAASVTPFFTNKSSAQCFLAYGSGGGNPYYSYLGLWSKAYYNAGKTNFGVDNYYARLYTTYTSSGEQKLFYDINKDQITDPGYAMLYAEPAINVYQKNVGGWIISPLDLDNWQGLYLKG